MKTLEKFLNSSESKHLKEILKENIKLVKYSAPYTECYEKMFRFIDVEYSLLNKINKQNNVKINVYNSLIHNSPPKLSILKEFFDLYNNNIKFEGFIIYNNNLFTENNESINMSMDKNQTNIYIDGFSLTINEKLDEDSIIKLSNIIKPFYFSKKYGYKDTYIFLWF